LAVFFFHFLQSFFFSTPSNPSNPSKIDRALDVYFRGVFLREAYQLGLIEEANRAEASLREAEASLRARIERIWPKKGDQAGREEGKEAGFDEDDDDAESRFEAEKERLETLISNARRNKTLLKARLHF
jgi:hypothetical protein